MEKNKWDASVSHTDWFFIAVLSYIQHAICLLKARVGQIYGLGELKAYISLEVLIKKKKVYTKLDAKVNAY